MRIRVDVGARLHVGFQNLSLAHERLYGGVGVALESPRVVLEAEPTVGIDCPDTLVGTYAERSCELLGVDGVSIDVVDALPRHVGVGSGTQTALATLAAVARAHGKPASVRELAPSLNRGGRSGVGVASFEHGGFVVDAGHPTERFTTAPPPAGEWTVPAITARHDLPEEWRFLVVLPDADEGRSGETEDESMRSVVENADPSIADSLATLLVRRLLPAAAEGRLEAFGDTVGDFGRLNGAWYADEQGGVYRPPAGRLIDELADSPAVRGVGQSSWGPAVYGVTDRSLAGEARDAADAALSSLGVDGGVRVVRPRNDGARITEIQ
ncbi:MAG: GHMP kinase [Natronomonas sp.]|jgi:beta-ribofuranosylaminobenzene 5'-phosphate synthase|uniref:beta-ribofuranosylaminobenzene 5'-phosphate synthase family protein n=1 Tax=Natronomonas sp. TaxID=2184060 RepID=UPI00286FC2FF|nr:beta-ribofuranosylaminobenzene 5'-phosphate synthase family protein [Natronomonas sp.]MDR9380295.1 GHMP kinase [Natronomonas sp.]MDR9431004.1 GHMP kinase [Natronomonas sp.]